MARQVKAGEAIYLRARFRDDLGDASTATDVYVHIFEPNSDITDLANATVVSGVPTLLGEGIYEYSYTTPGVGPDGTWYDTWQGTLTGQNLTANLTFEVGAEGSIESLSSQLTQNQVVSVTITSGIQDSDGNSIESDYTFEFMTTTSPAFTNLRKVRLEIGGSIPNLADDVIQTAILEASIEANAITFVPGRVNADLFNHARREYTTCLAASMLLTNTGSSALKSKTLGDLSVTYDTSSSHDAIDRVMNCLAKWEPQVMAGGGAKAAAQALGFVKGAQDPERPNVSRSWHTASNQVPAANTRERQASTERRLKRTFRKKWW